MRRLRLPDIVLRDVLGRALGRTGWQGTLRFWGLSRARQLHGRLRNGVAVARNWMIVAREGGMVGGARGLVRDIQAQLAKATLDAPVHTGVTVPSLLHFIHVDDRSCSAPLAEPWVMPLPARLAMTTAMRCNPGWQALLHTEHLPIGQEWQGLAGRVRVVRLPDAVARAPASMRRHGQLLYVLRLAILHAFGGACVDLRTLTLRPFAAICTADVVAGVRPADHPLQPGISDALLIARPGADAIGAWLAAADRVPLWRDATSQRIARFPLAPLAGRAAGLALLDHRAMWNFTGQLAETLAISPAGLRFAPAIASAVILQFERTVDGDPLDRVTAETLSAGDSIYARAALGRLSQPPDAM